MYVKELYRSKMSGVVSRDEATKNTEIYLIKKI